MVSDIIIGLLIAGGFFIVALIIQILGTLLLNWKNHKNKVKYMKKEYFFKQKISIFENIGTLSWKNHLALTTIENLNKLKTKNEENLKIIKQQLELNLFNFTLLLDKLIYFSSNLRKNLGRYITEFENYIKDKNFGEEIRTKELRENYKPFCKEINSIIEKEIKEIK